MDPTTLALFVVGLVLLLVGAKVLVDGASHLAALTGISPLVIGLTVVAFGSSSPELAVGVRGAMAGQADVAVGNVIGSNITNILLVLGLAALITPVAVHRKLVRVEVPLQIAVAGALLALAWDGAFSHLDGVLLCTGLFAYLAYTVRAARAEPDYGSPREDAAGGPDAGRRGVALAAVRVVAGLGMLFVGSGWLVDGAVAMAAAAGLTDLVISLTVVALGTSLPEIATTVMAALKGEADLAVGNVIGSNLFNGLAVLGVSALVGPEGLPVSAGAVSFDLPVMLAVSVACLPIFITGSRVSRLEGLLFVTYYGAFMTYALLRALEHDALAPFSDVMLVFVLPATGFGLLVSIVRAIRLRRVAAPG